MTSTEYETSLYPPDMAKMKSLTCDECGEIFEKPVLATVSSGDTSKTYYACPRCLTRVKEVPSPKTEEPRRDSASRRASEGHEKAGSECQHFFGFLKKRPKNMPIPDECLTCNKMIDCLT
ncbi:MAG: hypothetical protein QXG58_00450 [Candidatus Bathyarchaeia archaeon]